MINLNFKNKSSSLYKKLDPLKLTPAEIPLIPASKTTHSPTLPYTHANHYRSFWFIYQRGKLRCFIRYIRIKAVRYNLLKDIQVKSKWIIRGVFNYVPVKKIFLTLIQILEYSLFLFNTSLIFYINYMSKIIDYKCDIRIQEF